MSWNISKNADKRLIQFPPNSSRTSWTKVLPKGCISGEFNANFKKFPGTEMQVSWVTGLRQFSIYNLTFLMNSVLLKLSKLE